MPLQQFDIAVAYSFMHTKQFGTFSKPWYLINLSATSILFGVRTKHLNTTFRQQVHWMQLFNKRYNICSDIPFGACNLASNYKYVPGCLISERLCWFYCNAMQTRGIITIMAPDITAIVVHYYFSLRWHRKKITYVIVLVVFAMPRLIIALFAWNITLTDPNCCQRLDIVRCLEHR